MAVDSLLCVPKKLGVSIPDQYMDIFAMIRNIEERKKLFQISDVSMQTESCGELSSHAFGPH